jgi:LysR family transcriptional regulator (chromosome initiation inhibitor)
MPLLQGAPFVQDGRLIDLAPDTNIPVTLYWHCWNLKSKLLEKFTKQLTRGAKTLLGNQTG